MTKKYDWVVIGAGIYGLYAAILLAKQGKKIVILERDPISFGRASFVNQARVHLGYHYPRSISTAIKSIKYFERFNKEFKFAINNNFKKIYAISDRYSYTDGEQFKKFCQRAHIPCKEVEASDYFTTDSVESTFETEEYTFEASKIRDYLLSQLDQFPNAEIKYKTFITEVSKNNAQYQLKLNNDTKITTEAVINASYASTNQIAQLFGLTKFKVKYEICEIILCNTPKLKNIGITVMDGPFFSIMPFGLSGQHSLTSVTYTPHLTSNNDLPTFSCQRLNPNCSPLNLDNCNDCPARPMTAWTHMQQIAKKYLVAANDITYSESLFAIKPILKASEVDDSRPTLIRELSKQPRFLSVLSGKINTIYDLEEHLNG